MRAQGNQRRRERRQALQAVPPSPRLLRTTRLQFLYTFESGGRLEGWLEGDRLWNRPNLVFNLRSLTATYQDQSLRSPLYFDTVYGQCNLDFPGALFFGSNAATHGFFSFNYRSLEAIVYDQQAGGWLAEGWHPSRWQIQELASVKSVGIPASSLRAKQSA